MRATILKYQFIISLLFLGFGLLGCSEDDPVIYNSEVEVSFALENDENNLLVGQTISFNNTTTSNQNNVEYLWDFGDNSEISTEKNPTHIYTELGDYVVTLTGILDNTQDISSNEFTISLSSAIEGRNTILEELDDLDNKIMVCAHRGQHENAPENSLESVQLAIDQNIRMVELDVRQTKDGILVLMHDDTIDRTTNGTGNIEDMTFQELQQFYLYKDNGTLTTQRIPSLADVFKLARGHLYIDLDIHNKAPHQKVLQLVKKYGMLNQVIVYTKELTAINNLYQNLAVMPMIEDQITLDYFSDLDIDVTHFNNSTFNQDMVDQAKQQGWYIFKNAYVNTSNGPGTDSNARINLIINLEGDIVQTDYPTYIKNYLASQNLN